MNDNYLSILSHLKKLGGQAHVGKLTKATGLKAKDINNALRFIEPKYIEKVRRLEPHEWDGRGDEPKVLRLTQAGSEKADEYDEPEVPEFDERVDSMFERLWAQNTRLERQVTVQQKQIERLKKFVIEDT